jgi:hypothetical protein
LKSEDHNRKSILARLFTVAWSLLNICGSEDPSSDYTARESHVYDFLSPSDDGDQRQSYLFKGSHSSRRSLRENLRSAIDA